MNNAPATTARDALYTELARIGKVVCHPKRIELLELLCQGERPVEALARAAGLRLTTASTHLQVLRQARLVETRRQGTRIYYRSAGEEVCRFVGTLGELGRARLVEVREILQAAAGEPWDLEPVTRDQLLARAARGDVVVLDVRPRDEYHAGHVPGALSVPLDELPERLAALPPDRTVVAYCRGPYCLLAAEAVSRLRRAGVRAARLQDGMPEWRQAGLPVAMGPDPGQLALAG
ncbi:MAG TPA: metalloregulator ArsR/SmtB family transcription factor [Candidatus Dormibacteraeota bacterium]|nr:metalloregulator ArsR/SmtB family transcription factor [Candidatus Dormibacteraeota bacterium]